jgi:hypothetical protein
MWKARDQGRSYKWTNYARPLHYTRISRQFFKIMTKEKESSELLSRLFHVYSSKKYP